MVLVVLVLGTWAAVSVLIAGLAGLIAALGHRRAQAGDRRPGRAGPEPQRGA